MVLSTFLGDYKAFLELSSRKMCSAHVEDLTIEIQTLERTQSRFHKVSYE